MAGDPLRKVHAGEPLRIPAEAYNAFVDAARAHRDRANDQGAGMRAVPPEAGVVLVRNDSGSNVERFGILSISSPIISPTDNADEFYQRVALSGITPGAGTRGKFIVLLEPLAPSAIGRGVISGVVACRLSVSDAITEYSCADVEPGSREYLVPGAQPGSAQILWRESGTGLKWAVVRIGNHECTTSTSTTTTSTTTTTTPCGGSCTWSWSSVTKSWTKTADTCTGSCKCSPPGWCGHDLSGCSNAETARTYCRPQDVGPQPCCSGTTSTTTSTTSTTTTTPNGCADGCDWRYKPGTPGNFGGWVRTANGCLPSCECLPPEGTGSDCDTEHTPCNYQPPTTTTTTRVGCTGFCTYFWNPDSTPPQWELLGHDCAPSGLCACYEPSVDGSDCAIVKVSCAMPTTTTTTLAGTTTTTLAGTTTTTQGCRTTTTTPPPGSCTGDCWWRGDGFGGWTLVNTTCGNGCACLDKPPYASGSSCEVGVTPCRDAPWTTTTTTTSTTTTTTTTPCGGYCRWHCDGVQWVLIENTCSPTCTCNSAVLAACCNATCGNGAVITAACIPTTTTTAGSTSTTGGA